METLSVRDYRNNLAASFAKADEGESVFIKRKNQIYALVHVGQANLMITPEMQHSISEAREEFRNGKTRHFNNAASMQQWLDEL